MAGQINIAGTSGSVQLFGNDTIVTDINIYFPPAGGLLFANGNALEATTGTFSGDITSAGNADIGGRVVANGQSAISDNSAQTIASYDKDGNLIPTFSVTAGGSITAAGTLDVSGSFMRTGGVGNSDTTSGVECYNQGLLAVQTPLASADDTVCFKIQHGTPVTTQFEADGSGFFANNNLSWDDSGSITAAGSLTASSGYFDRKVAPSSTTLVVQDRGTRNLQIFGDGTTHIGGTLTGNVTTDSPNLSLGAGGSITAAGTLTFAERPSGGYYGGFDANGSLVLYDDSTSTITLTATNGEGRFQYVTVQTMAGVGTRPVYCDSSGGLTISSSDRKLKKNIKTLPSQTDRVKALNPVSFNWKETNRLGGDLEIGFIAQEVQEVVPEVVRTNADGTLALDYPKLTATLTSALQTALTRIEELEAKVAALES